MVALPPFMVDEMAKGPPWRYTRSPDFEILSRCDDRTTYELTATYHRLHRLLELILPSSLQVTLDMMCAHGAAVVRGSYHAAVVVDMPFGAYEASPQQAFESAARLLKETGCAAVKLEGGAAMAETVAFLTARGIPVMGHVGLTPQAVNVLGGYNARGRSEAEAAKIVADAQALDEAGAFAVVVEGVVEPIAIAVTKAIRCPTIGIGASAQCDGQVLVTEDMLGMFERVPRFVKIYENIADTISGAAATYAAEVRSRAFPGIEQTYQPK